MSRRGFVLSMWTGLFPINRYGQPTLFRTVASARKHLSRYPGYGHCAVRILFCVVRRGSNGKRDFFIGKKACS